jgi:hypothetical protein
VRSLSRTWPPVTDRYARMRKRAATVPNADELRAAFEHTWAEAGAPDQQPHRLMLLPGPERRPTRAERRRNRMREHTRTLLINALRSDGTYGSHIRVQICKMYRVLPWDIGFAHASRITDGITSADEIRAEKGLALKQRTAEAAATLNDQILGPMLWDLQLETDTDVEPGLHFEFTDEANTTDPGEGA